MSDTQNNTPQPTPVEYTAPKAKDLRELVEKMQKARKEEMQRNLDIAYTYHKPLPSQVPVYETLRAKAKEFAQLCLDLVPAGRELEVAQARIAEAVMWANKGVACNSYLFQPVETTQEAKDNV